MISRSLAAQATLDSGAVSLPSRGSPGQRLCSAAGSRLCAGAAPPASGGEGDLVLYFKGHFSSTKSSQTRAAAGRRRMSDAVRCEAQAMPPQPPSPPWHSGAWQGAAPALLPLLPFNRAVGCREGSREVPRGAEQGLWDPQPWVGVPESLPAGIGAAPWHRNHSPWSRASLALGLRHPGSSKPRQEWEAGPQHIPQTSCVWPSLFPQRKVRILCKGTKLHHHTPNVSLSLVQSFRTSMEKPKCVVSFTRAAQT